MKLFQSKYVNHNMSIAQSIFSLCKNNNGFFKSEKQAAFLTKMLNQETHLCSNSVHGNQVSFHVSKWDSRGIVRIEKYSHTTHKSTIYFERKIEGILTEKEKKIQKQIRREMKRLEKQIHERQIAYDSGKYAKDEFSLQLFDKSQKRDLQSMEILKLKICD